MRKSQKSLPMSSPSPTHPLKVRDSNMELLRIVSMFLVLLVHADYLSLGAPSSLDVAIHPAESFMKMLFYSISTVCVNCFVLLSGWYGIRPKLKRLGEFLFQVFFISGLTLSVYILCSRQRIDVDDIKSLFLLTDDLWFVKSYLVLYLLSPALNSFCGTSSRRQYQLVLCGLFLLQTVLGWGFVVVPWFDGGYSPLSFILLYLLGQYLHRYPSKYTDRSSTPHLACYVCMTVLCAAINFISLYVGIGEGVAWMSYISPIVIFNSVLLLLYFSKLSLHSKKVNWVARSCFAVYLVHCTRHVLEWYCEEVRANYGGNNYLTIAVLMLSIYASAILLDKARIYVWELLTRKKGKENPRDMDTA